VISLLNRYYIPVYTSNEDYRDKGAAPPEERAEHQRIFLEFIDGKLGTGDVHVYILKPDGHALNGLGVVEAANTEKMIARLEEDARLLNTEAGKPVIPPRVQSTAPKAAPDALVLHLTSRADGTGPTGGSWREFPSENWIVFERAQWTRFLPTGKAEVGKAWEMDRETAAKLLVYFYPQTEQTEDNKIAHNRIDSLTLRATVVAVKAGMVRIRLDGSLRMKHTFYPGHDDNNFVDAAVLGYVEAEPGKSRLRSFQMVTEKATYANSGFSVAVHSIP
jgi:hypothetical protein